jgi:predicted N-acyltransferase
VRPGESPEELYPVFAAAVRRLSAEAGVSGAHVLFSPENEAQALADAGLARRLGVQFHWHNDGYESFDHFLSRFNAKRRHQIKRERREVLAQGVDVSVKTGRELTPALADFVYAFYRNTVDKFVWGRRYLKREFFEEVLSRMASRLHVVVAADRASGALLAGAFNLLGEDALYGRYWGALEERAFLHFEVCFYKGIEEAIERRLLRFEPGAGGEHKIARGFEPSLTYSLHHLVDRRLDHAVRDFLGREEAAVHSEVATARAEMGMKPSKKVSG